VIFFFCDRAAVLRWIDSWKIILKMLHIACLLPRKVAIETVRNFASSDLVSLLRSAQRSKRHVCTGKNTSRDFPYYCLPTRPALSSS